jgi:hypothetical protein
MQLLAPRALIHAELYDEALQARSLAVAGKIA